MGTSGSEYGGHLLHVMPEAGNTKLLDLRSVYLARGQKNGIRARRIQTLMADCLRIAKVVFSLRQRIAQL